MLYMQDKVKFKLTVENDVILCYGCGKMGVSPLPPGWIVTAFEHRSAWFCSVGCCNRFREENL